MIRTLKALALAAVASVTGQAVALEPAASGERIAEETWLFRGAFVPGRQPDGNSLMLQGPQGWVVFDSGRHAAHTQRLLDQARASHAPITALINSHWHLDHVGGNPKIRAAFPEVRVYASRAVEAAMGGFLANYRQQLLAMIEQSAADPAAQAAFRTEVGLIDAGPALFPDVALTAAQTTRAAGRELQLHVAGPAVTGGDVWLFDPATRVLAAGDLVTLPVPFFDTACPSRWRSALDELAAVEFRVLVPGHGEPMSRAQFERYRGAFDRLLSCAAETPTNAVCIDGWIKDSGDLLPSAQHEQARGMLAYYLDTTLRADAGALAGRCGAAAEK